MELENSLIFIFSLKYYSDNIFLLANISYKLQQVLWKNNNNKNVFCLTKKHFSLFFWGKV